MSNGTEPDDAVPMPEFKERRRVGCDGARALLIVPAIPTMHNPWRKAVIIAQCSDGMLRELAINALLNRNDDMITVCGAEVVWRPHLTGNGNRPPA